MSGRFKKIIKKIKNLNLIVEKYKQETVIQSLPSVAQVNRAKRMINDGRPEEAKEVLLEALELPNKDPLVYKYLGLVYDILHDYPNAAEAYRNSAGLNPQDKIIWQKLGFALIAVGRYADAEKSFENAQKVMPGSTDTFTGWGMALMKADKLQEAAEKFAQASTANKYNFMAIFLAAVTSVKLGEYDKADAKLAFLANVCPNETNAYEYANLKYLRGDLNNAIFYAEKSLEYNPGMLPAYVLLGKLYTHKCDREQALRYFETAYEKDLINTNLYLEWACAFIKFGMYGQAKEKLSAALALEPDNADLKANLALCYALAGNIEDAQNCIKDITANPVCSVVSGIIAYENAEYEKAVDFLKKTLDDEADNFVSHYYLAKSYRKLNNRAKTQEHFDAALDENPEYLQARLDYAEYFISEGDYAEARRKLRKALKSEPDNPELLNLLFFAGYMLVKENSCGYNIKEVLAAAAKIPPEFFRYSKQKEELEEILGKI
ncbi:MAG: tetratricopeptide repeat protein [Heliobacteriaceae bacterium]|nr:tetratricopeptide repeat protein [Heliobacteriaceae bacterium]